MSRILQREVPELFELAARGGLGSAKALYDCIAEGPDQLMYMEGDTLVILRDTGPDLLAYCEGDVGWVKRSNVALTGALASSSSTPSSPDRSRSEPNTPPDMASVSPTLCAPLGAGAGADTTTHSSRNASAPPPVPYTASSRMVIDTQAAARITPDYRTSTASSYDLDSPYIAHSPYPVSILDDDSIPSPRLDIDQTFSALRMAAKHESPASDYDYGATHHHTNATSHATGHANAIAGAINRSRTNSDSSTYSSGSRIGELVLGTPKEAGFKTSGSSEDGPSAGTGLGLLQTPTPSFAATLSLSALGVHTSSRPVEPLRATTLALERTGPGNTILGAGSVTSVPAVDAPCASVVHGVGAHDAVRSISNRVVGGYATVPAVTVPPKRQSMAVETSQYSDTTPDDSVIMDGLAEGTESEEDEEEERPMRITPTLEAPAPVRPPRRFAPPALSLSRTDTNESDASVPAGSPIPLTPMSLDTFGGDGLKSRENLMSPMTPHFPSPRPPSPPSLDDRRQSEGESVSDGRPATVDCPSDVSDRSRSVPPLLDHDRSSSSKMGATAQGYDNTLGPLRRNESPSSFPESVGRQTPDVRRDSHPSEEGTVLNTPQTVPSMTFPTEIARHTFPDASPNALSAPLQIDATRRSSDGKPLSPGLSSPAVSVMPESPHSVESSFSMESRYTTKTTLRNGFYALGHSPAIIPETPPMPWHEPRTSSSSQPSTPSLPSTTTATQTSMTGQASPRPLPSRPLHNGSNSLSSSPFPPSPDPQIPPRVLLLSQMVTAPAHAHSSSPIQTVENQKSAAASPTPTTPATFTPPKRAKPLPAIPIASQVAPSPSSATPSRIPSTQPATPPISTPPIAAPPTRQASLSSKPMSPASADGHGQHQLATSSTSGSADGHHFDASRHRYLVGRLDADLSGSRGPVPISFRPFNNSDSSNASPTTVGQNGNASNNSAGGSPSAPNRPTGGGFSRSGGVRVHVVDLPQQVPERGHASSPAISGSPSTPSAPRYQHPASSAASNIVSGRRSASTPSPVVATGPPPPRPLPRHQGSVNGGSSRKSPPIVSSGVPSPPKAADGSPGFDAHRPPRRSTSDVPRPPRRSTSDAPRPRVFTAPPASDDSHSQLPYAETPEHSDVGHASATPKAANFASAPWQAQQQSSATQASTNSSGASTPTFTHAQPRPSLSSDRRFPSLASQPQAPQTATSPPPVKPRSPARSQPRPQPRVHTSTPSQWQMPKQATSSSSHTPQTPSRNPSQQSHSAPATQASVSHKPTPPRLQTQRSASSTLPSQSPFSTSGSTPVSSAGGSTMSHRARSRSFSATIAKVVGMGSKQEHVPPVPFRPSPPPNASPSPTPGSVGPMSAGPNGPRRDRLPFMFMRSPGSQSSHSSSGSRRGRSSLDSTMSIRHMGMGNMSGTTESLPLSAGARQGSVTPFTPTAPSRSVSTGRIKQFRPPVSHRDFADPTINEDGMEFEIVHPPSKISGSAPKVSLSIDGHESIKDDLPDVPLEVDEWGFIKDKSPTPAIFQTRRQTAGDVRSVEQKWLSIIQTPLALGQSPNKRVRRLVIEQGVPASLRGRVWGWLMSNGVSGRVEGLFPRLLTNDPAPYDEQLDHDVQTVYTDHATFARRGGTGQADLRTLLKAYMNFAPNGYHSELALIAGALLVHAVVEDAFWLMAGLFNGVLKTYYVKDKFAFRVDLHVFASIVQGSEPKLGSLFRQADIAPHDYLRPWWMSMFLRHLPWPTALRVFDAVITEGPRFLMIASLAILGLSRDRLLGLPPTRDVVLNYLLHLPQDSLLLPETFMRACDEVKLRDEDLKKLRSSVKVQLATS